MSAPADHVHKGKTVRTRARADGVVCRRVLCSTCGVTFTTWDGKHEPPRGKGSRTPHPKTEEIKGLLLAGATQTAVASHADVPLHVVAHISKNLKHRIYEQRQQRTLELKQRQQKLASDAAKSAAAASSRWYTSI